MCVKTSAESLVPAHFDVAYIRVEIEQGPDAYGKSHYFIELRPFGWVQIEHVQDELSEFWAVPVRNRSECSAHDFQNKGGKILKEILNELIV